MSSRRLLMTSPEFDPTSRIAGRVHKLARGIVLSRLRNLVDGQLVVEEGGYRLTFGQRSDEFPKTVVVRVHSPRFYSDIAFGGSIGSGEAYMRGRWSSSDLGEALRILLRNRDVLEKIDSGLAWLSKPSQKIFHILNRNTRNGSRKNIAAHYDLGNDFYQLWLDPTMTYSCAFFESGETSLHEASIEKNDRICRRLKLSADDSLIEIGTGWGGFAIHAARNYGCRVTTTTISREQHDFAAAAIREAGLQDRITLLLKDYRELAGSYDKLVSIEMIEAVGHEYHETFFKKCNELLKPDGQMLLQSITIADQRYEQYKRGVDFIKRYIFPGGCLTSVTDMTRILTRATDLRVIDLEDIGLHYATTLSHWKKNFFSALGDIEALGYSAEFLRMWEYYLCFCESAFRERVIGDVQMHMMRPWARP